MRQTVLLFLVMLFSTLTFVGCSKTATDKLNGTWKQDNPGTETMILDFNKKHATFINGSNGETNESDFTVSSELESEANIIFSLNGKSIYSKFILSNESGTKLIAKINNVDYFYTKESESIKTGK